MWTYLCISLSLYIYIYIHVTIGVCIYIYRERERCIHICQYYMHRFICQGVQGRAGGRKTEITNKKEKTNQTEDLYNQNNLNTTHHF